MFNFISYSLVPSPSFKKVFMYAFPVTVIACIVCVLTSLAVEETVLTGVGDNSVWGFFGSNFRFLISLGAAFVSGILGIFIEYFHILFLNNILQQWNEFLFYLFTFFCGTLLCFIIRSYAG